MATQKPTVFIGSSTESLPVVKAVEISLNPIADVIIWTDKRKFRKIGEYFLDSLIAASGQFDFAVLIFEPNDVIASRKIIQQAPRDNVVFELGLFLSRLGRRRTFVIAPTVWKSDLKILTDLQGLTLAEYDPPKRKMDLEANLKDVCREIQKHIRDQGPRNEPRGPKGVTEVRQPLEDLIATARAGNVPVLIRNLALDMEMTWPLARDMLLSQDHIEDITWLSLMVDTQSQQIQGLWSDTVSKKVASNAEDSIQKFCKNNDTELKRRNVRFECKAYSEVPTMHGFLFNDNALFVTLCGIEDKKLLGAPNPYLRLDSPRHPSSDQAAVHFLNSFESWFQHRWHKARKIRNSSNKICI